MASMSYQPPSRDLLVKDVLREIDNSELVNPFFQREFVWSIKKQREFIAYTLQCERLEAPVHTYCLSGSFVRFLKDGRQRLTTLSRAIKTPKQFDLTREEVDALKNVGVHIMHMLHDTHETAMVSFQNLNKGTGLLPYDLWRGELAATEVGARLYDRVCHAVVHVTSKLAGEDVLKTADMSADLGSGGRKRNGQLNRGALALFYMWIAKKPVISKILTHDTATKSRQPEVLTADFIRANNWSIADCDREVNRFYSYLENVVALVERLVIARDASFNGTHKRWEIQAVRAIFNAAVYVSLRDDIPAGALETFINWYLERADGYPEWVSRFIFTPANSAQEKEECRMSQHNLYWIREPAEQYGIHVPRKTKKTKLANVRGKKGCHASHTIPACEGGSETVLEDAITNLSRGAREMTAEEIAALTTTNQGENSQSFLPFTENN
jgi:hypothetical protein